jgi:DNA-binding response OmpR family regulator
MLPQNSTYNQQLVLAIDDEPVVLDVQRRLLERSGFRVLGALTAAAGLHLARTHTPQAILLDLTIPGINPGELLAALREACPGAPVIVCSGLDAAAAFQAFGVKAGPDGFVQKPFSGGALAGELERAAERQRRRPTGTSSSRRRAATPNPLPPRA